MQNYRSSGLYSRSKSLYPLAYAKALYDTIHTGVDLSTANTFKTMVSMYQHSSAVIMLLGNSYNANRRGDYVFPIDSSRGTTVEVWMVSLPSDVGNTFQPIPQALDPAPTRKVSP